VTIEGPWGSGKTTLMDLVRQRLTEIDGPTLAPAGVRIRHLTVREATRYLRQPPDEQAVMPAHLADSSSDRRIVTAWLNPWAHRKYSEIVWLLEVSVQVRP